MTCYTILRDLSRRLETEELCLDTTIGEYHREAKQNQGPFPPDLPTPTQCMKKKTKKLSLAKDLSFVY